MRKYSMGWYIYSTLVLILTLGVCIYQKNSLILVVTTISGIIYVLLTAKVNKYGLLFGIVNVILYGIILLNEKIYGGTLYNLAYALPMMIYGYIKYAKDDKNSNLGIKTISTKARIWAITILVMIIAISSYILSLFNSNLAIIDSTTTILGFVGIYLLSNKYKEQWMVWIISNLMNVIMWTILTIENIEKLPMLIMWIVYLINSIYGLIYWNKLNKSNKV